MCVICVSGRGVPQPSKRAITNMFTSNNHGAGYMYAKDGFIYVHKGFDSLADYLEAIQDEKFSVDDVVVYHFRIATQARRFEMTQPFPLTDDEEQLTAWDAVSKIGVAHNGIIYRTSNGNPLLSDTALYIRDYLSQRIRTERNITKKLLDTIEAETTGSKIAILAGSGNYYLTGQWIYDRGLLYSNDSYQDHSKRFTFANVKTIEWSSKASK